MQKLSLRPSQVLLGLYKAIQEAEPEYPETDRKSISERALIWFKENANDELIREAAGFKLNKTYYPEGELPKSFKITVDEEGFDTLSKGSEDIKRVLNLKRITSTYTLKLILSAYLLFLKKSQVPDVNIEESVCFQDLLFLKASFDAYCCTERPEDKQRLLESSRTILEIDTRLYTRLREQYSKKLQGFSRYFIPDLKRRSDFSKPNITFLSKALGGFFLVQAELEDEADILERAAIMAQEALDREIIKRNEA